MAKTIKIQNTTYDVFASVCIRSANGLELVEFSGQGAASKNARVLKNTIRDSYEYDENGERTDITVIAIDNIRAYKNVEVTTYRVNASNGAIIAACKKAGLDVVLVGEDEQIFGENETELVEVSEDAKA